MKSEVNQTELAGILGLSTRQIRNLEVQGLPHRSEANRKLYPIPGAVQWYAEHRRDLALAEAQSGDFKEAQRRREIARARQEEIALARQEERLVLREHHDEQCGRAFDLVRTALLNMPGRWGAQMGFDSPREGEAALKRISVEILEELSDAAADHIAMGGADPLPGGFPCRSMLVAAGVETVSDLLVLDDPRSIRGIGPAGARKIRKALDELGHAAA